MMGVLSAWTSPSRHSTAEASTVLAWARAKLHRMRDLPELEISLARLTAEQLETQRYGVQDLTTERVEQRATRARMRTGCAIARQTGGEVALELHISEQELAKLAATTTFINRILSHWKRLGAARAGCRRALIERPHTFDRPCAQGISGVALHTDSVLSRAAGKGRLVETFAGGPSIVVRTRNDTAPTLQCHVKLISS